MSSRTPAPFQRRGRSLLAALCSALLATGLSLGTAVPAQADDVRSDEHWLKDLGITEAQKISKGAGVKVAIIDTGVDTTHPDLKGAVVGGADMSGAGAAQGQNPIGAMSEHGTLVATMLAGRGNNKSEIERITSENERLKKAWERAKKSAEEDDDEDTKPPKEPEYEEVPELGPGSDGMLGVAPEADLLSVSLWMGGNNPAGVSVEEQIPKAVRWAVDNGAKVINMSLGSTSPAWPESWDDAFKYAEDKDVVIVAAAGNRSGGMSQVGAPATIPGVLTVAGVDAQDKASQDSSTEGISIGVAADAEQLVGGLPGGGYARWSGTSGAAPIVSGVVAMIRSKYPEMKAPQVINRILQTARDVGEPGQDNLYGYGILNAQAALTAQVPVAEANPMDTITEWIRVHRRGKQTPPVNTDPGVSVEKSTIKPIAAPTPVAPEPAMTGLQATIVIGGGALVLLVLVIGGLQIASAARRERAAAIASGASIGTLPVDEPGRNGRDFFDDLPEERD
ncbi:S8 family serine peptidase [Glutamicibacter endophyticus]|uniref:S8 family serine peptidase n=1 Tax=Glutamicibacter endophyticus TaxID=1522174 RepID=UPI003AEFBA91